VAKNQLDKGDVVVVFHTVHWGKAKPLRATAVEVDGGGRTRVEACNKVEKSRVAAPGTAAETHLSKVLKAAI